MDGAVKVTGGEIEVESSFLSPSQVKAMRRAKWERGMAKARAGNVSCHGCGVPSGAKRAGKGVTLKKDKQGNYWCHGCWK